MNEESNRHILEKLGEISTTQDNQLALIRKISVATVGSDMEVGDYTTLRITRAVYTVEEDGQVVGRIYEMENLWFSDWDSWNEIPASSRSKEYLLVRDDSGEVMDPRKSDQYKVTKIAEEADLPQLSSR